MAKGKFDMSEFLAPVEGVPESDTMREIAVDDILDNPLNFYPRPDNGKLAELMESIQANGLLEPPTVVPTENGKYRLISGHSRMEAVRMLSAHKGTAVAERFQRVLCRVLPSMTTEHEECAVIEANRQRVKSPALLAEEAERLTKIYIKRREAGEELPGRIRDRVAEAMQVNKTKLANLSAIKRGLKVPGIVRKWEAGDIPEAAALEIARMDDNTQYRLLDWMIEQNCEYSIREVRKFKICWGMMPHKCPDCGKFCPNASRMYDSRYYGGEFRCAGCCRKCLKKGECSAACKYVVAERPVEQKVEIPKNPAVDDPRLKGMTETFCSRVKTLREATGMTKKEFAESIDEYPGTYSAWENNSLAGAGSLPKLALTLGTTMDYLCGLTDDPSPTKAMSVQDGPVQAEKTKSKEERNEELLALRWYESNVEPPDGSHIILIDETGLVDDDEYIGGSLKSGYNDWDEVLLWTLHPDDSSPTKEVSSPGWLPLDAEHWPEEGALVVLSYPTGLGGSAYLTARCGGGVSDQYPFVSTDAGISVQDIVEHKCDSWMLISERQRGKK